MSNSLDDTCRALAWSQWVTLGVSGFATEATTAIELEPAIIFAAEIGVHDPRLRDEVLDWCIRFASQFISLSVLKHVVRRFNSAHFDRFAATVNAHAGTRWPTQANRDTRFRPSGKSQCRIDRAAAIGLRARKIFGVNARADLLSTLALHPDVPQPSWLRISSFNELGYTKRNISSALHDLEAGGVLQSFHIGNALSYRLRSREAVFELLAPLPRQMSPAWGPRLALAANLLELRRVAAGKSPVTIAVEIRKLVARHDILPMPELDLRDPWSTVDAWLNPWLQP